LDLAAAAAVSSYQDVLRMVVNVSFKWVCCLNINEGGMGMINIDNFVKSKHKIYMPNNQQWDRLVECDR
jgi:hypothetical protein